MKIKYLIMTGSVLALAACATPPPEPQPQPVADTTSPAPTPAAPQPAAPVTRSPLPPTTTAPVYSGPIPGSLDDFLYAAGGESRVFFAYNQYDLSPGARDYLRAQAAWLTTYPQVMAVIEGNADERGTREYNLALGARRAEAVKSFLVGLGIAPNRLTTVSYGKERPIDPGSTEDAWARNRNAHTNLLSGTIG